MSVQMDDNPSPKPVEVTNYFTLSTVLIAYPAVGGIVTMLGTVVPKAQNEFSNISTSLLSSLFLLLSAGAACGNILCAILYINFTTSSSSLSQGETKHEGPVNKALFNYLRPYSTNQKFLIVGTCITAITFILASLSAKSGIFPIFMVLHFFIGIASSFVDVPCNCIAPEDVNVLVQYDTRKIRLPLIKANIALGLMHTGFELGAIVIPFFVNGLPSLFLFYLMYGGICLLIFIYAIFVMNVDIPSTRSSLANSNDDTQQIDISNNIIIPEQVDTSTTNNIIPEDETITDILPVESSPSFILSTPPSPLFTDSPLVSLSRQSAPPSRWIATLQLYFHTTLSLLLSPGYTLLLFSTTFYVGAEIIVGGWVSSMVIQDGHAQYGGLATTIFWTGMASARFVVSGILSMPIFRTHKNLINLLRGSCLAAIASTSLLVVLPYPHTLWMAGVTGATYSPIIPNLIYLCSEWFPDPDGSTLLSLAGLLFFANIGAAVFPFITGVISSFTLSYRTGMWAGVGSCSALFICLVIIPYLPDIKKKINK